MTEITIELNGGTRTGTVDPRVLLVEALRETFGVTGPKIGCLTGDCGACTVVMDGATRKSCLTLACAADGATITTLEGVADGDALSVVQSAFWDAYGFQCGFCLSGMVLCAEELLRRTTTPSDDEIDAAISGNLCRCTGYTNIRRAIRLAGERLTGDAP